MTFHDWGRLRQFNEEGDTMVSGVGSITAEEATKELRRLVALNGGDRDGLQKVADLLSLTLRKVEYQFEKAKNEENISSDTLVKMVWRIKESRMFGLEIDDPRLAQPDLSLWEDLLEETRAEVMDEFRGRTEALDEREADLNRREDDLAEETKRSQAEMQRKEESLGRRHRELIELQREVSEEKTEVEVREAEVRSQAAEVKRREERISEPEIIRRALAPGGLLAPGSDKSLELAEAEFAERYWQENGGSPDRARDARDRRIELEQKERTFNAMTALLRVTIYATVSLEKAKRS